MATEKIANYTADQVTEMVATYSEAPAQATVEMLAEKFGKSARSVIAKLAKEGVYKAQAKTAGKREMLKAEMVTELAALTGATEDQIGSLEKATGPALMVILVALRKASAAE